MKGYLTYTLSALAILGAGAGYLMSWVSAEDALKVLWAGLTAFGLGRAIK